MKEPKNSEIPWDDFSMATRTVHHSPAFNGTRSSSHVLEAESWRRCPGLAPLHGLQMVSLCPHSPSPKDPVLLDLATLLSLL
jgi:hypothetical protein